MSAGRSLRTGIAVSALGTLMVAMAACGGASTASSKAAPSIDKASFTVAFPGPPDVADIPVLAAIHNLDQMGYNAKVKDFNGGAVATEAVIANHAQVTAGSPAALFKADIKGDHLVTFAIKTTNEFALVAQSKYKTPQDLNGAQLGLASPTTSTHTLILWSEKKYHFKPDIVYVGSSPVRAQALLAGRLAATVLELDDVTKVERASPGKFHDLIDYAKVLPNLFGDVFMTNAAYLKSHPTVLKAFTQQLDSAYKQAYQHPKTFEKLAPKYIKGYTPAAVAKTMNISVKFHIWGPAASPGLMTTAAARSTLAFFTKAGEINAAGAKKLANLHWFYGAFTHSG